MPDPFESVLWKIGRAKVHYESAKNAFKALVDADPYKLTGDFDRNRRILRVRVATVGDIPQDFCLAIGDAAHNARSALDHLMFALARPATQQQARCVSFPIENRMGDFRNTISNARRCPIPGVPRGVKTVLERLQPYHRRKRPDAAILWKLKKLDDWDKHRMLSTSIASLAGFEAAFKLLKLPGTTAVLDKRVFPNRILKPRTIIARLQFSTTMLGAEVQVTPKLEIQPVFDSRAPGEIERLNALDVIRRAIKFIERDVIPSFRPFV